MASTQVKHNEMVSYNIQFSIAQTLTPPPRLFPLVHHTEPSDYILKKEKKIARSLSLSCRSRMSLLGGIQAQQKTALYLYKIC